MVTADATRPAYGPILGTLESEAIEILREGVATAERPVMLYSIGKDSSVLLHLARKAFWPAPVPVPLLHIDTTWKFREMIAFRDRTAAELGLDLRVHTNQEGLRAGVNPFDHGSAHYTDVMKTQALRQALDAGRYDVVFGGARRDEERSRAKERVFSLRNRAHQWEPRTQRPEIWNLYNTRVRPGESLRVSPLSNWTEGDVWRYIAAEEIPVVPLYFAKERPVVERDGGLILVDDGRMRLRIRQVHDRQPARKAPHRRGAPHLRARRGQRPPRVEPRSGLHRGRPRGEHPAGGRSGPPHGGCRADRHCGVHQPLPRGPGPRPAPVRTR